MFNSMTMDASQLRDKRIRIVNTTKSNGAGRTSLCACSCKFAIHYFTSFCFGLVFRLVNTLDTERAFFHHTAAADSYVRIQLIWQRFRTFVITPVEGTYLIRTVVRAVTCTDTTV